MKVFWFAAIVFPVMVLVSYFVLEAIHEHTVIYQECGGVYCPQDETR